MTLVLYVFPYALLLYCAEYGNTDDNSSVRAEVIFNISGILKAIIYCTERGVILNRIMDRMKR